MEQKKNPEISLEKRKGLFFQIGLVVTLVIVLVAFEWRSYDKVEYNLGQLNLDDMEEEIIPITKQEEKPPPPPPPPPEIIEIIEDDEEIENELEVEDTESDEDIEIEIEEEDDDEFFMVVENMPEFPGGDLGLMKYIQKNVKYPAIAKEYNITGKVYVSFIVDKTGSVTNVKVVRGVDKNLDAEAVRVVKSLPKYKPGKQRGKAVRVMFTIPINFTLN
ncbi:MAG: energy transducer TonB [Flavobacteriales bacterium]|nr:energy transducer TonB [Flavobacteriales bacterium]|tara:strand:- start:77192 stop:77845 length:654 start_codon:yes stop_codon:yes gene_type:complete